MKQANPKKANVRLMTELSLLTAIVLLMAFTPLGYLRVGAVEITFIVVPVAIGGVMLGIGGGAFLGLVFGLTSFVQCFGMSAFGTMLFGINPLATAFCCIVPRVLVGVVPALVYRGLSRLDNGTGFSIALSCLLAPVTNTVLYLGCMCVFFQTELTEAYSYTGTGGVYFLGWLLALVAVNAALEAASSLILGTAICKALQKTVHRGLNVNQHSTQSI